MRHTLLTLIYLFCTQLVRAQGVIPAEGSALHYILVGFSDPAAKGKCTFEIADGLFEGADFDKNIVVKLSSNTNKVVGRVPGFGRQYSWRVKSSQPGGYQSRIYHFRTDALPCVDTTLFRLRIDRSNKKYSGCYLFLDFNKVLFDMNGVPVWHLPDIDGITYENAMVRDLKLTSAGTITLLLNNFPYEIAYDGRVLWKAPKNGVVSGYSMEHFHHELTRLSNGHYMTMGNENLPWEPATPQPGSGKKVSFGTLIEYDKSGKVVWSWKSAPYHQASNFTMREGADYDTHQNAFWFDEKRKYIYTSFKNIDRILKIKYPSGKLEASYTGPFCDQHNCRVSSTGLLYMFNNNSCTLDRIPTAVFLKEPARPGGPLKTVWEYRNKLNITSVKLGEVPRITNGGSVTELRDGSILISNCSPYADISIVDRNKNIIWCALPEHWHEGQKIWVECPQYRVSLIEDKASLEKAIWNK